MYHIHFLGYYHGDGERHGMDRRRLETAYNLTPETFLLNWHGVSFNSSSEAWDYINYNYRTNIAIACGYSARFTVVG